MTFKQQLLKMAQLYDNVKDYLPTLYTCATLTSTGQSV